MSSIKITIGRECTLAMILKDRGQRPVSITPFAITSVIKKATTEGATLSSLTVTVTDAAAGAFTVSANAAVTTALPEGSHPIVVRFTRISDSVVVNDVVLDAVVKRGITF